MLVLCPMSVINQVSRVPSMSYRVAQTNAGAMMSVVICISKGLWLHTHLADQVGPIQPTTPHTFCADVSTRISRDGTETRNGQRVEEGQCSQNA